MAIPINILIVEDSVADALLLVEAMKSAGFEPKWKRVQTEADYLAGLEDSPDIILSDYSLPQFDGLRAMDLLRERGLDIPFILLSGTVGEEQAVEAMQHGVTDYLLKDRIGRLGNAVERALEQKRLRAERGRMEQQLALQAAALENAANGVLITDRAGTILWANAAFTATTGYAAEEVIGKTPRVLKSGKHEQKFYSDFWWTILSGKTWRGEFINRRKDGSIYYDEHTVAPVRSRAGKITHFIGIMNDVTARKELEDEARSREERYRTLIEQARDAVFTLAPDQTITSLNAAFETITGFARAEWIRRMLPPLIHPDDLPKAMEVFQRVMRNEKPPPFELRLRTKAGGSVTLEFTVTQQFHGGSVSGVMGIGRDATERKQLEAQFRQAQKMEAIGQLAAGVAHDFNNMLAVIHGNAEMALLFADQPANARECVNQVIAASERAASLTRQLLAFGRKQTMQSQPLDLNDVIGNLTKMLSRIIGENIRLQCTYAASLPVVQADISMMEQVLVNLVVNARDAMPKGGQLLITTEKINVDEAYAQTHPEAHTGECICITVTDTGTGIAPEHLARIFEPFYTTKEAGKGTGLGLATVFGIVKQHQGWIELATLLNAGTTFKIFLPAIPAPSMEAAAPPPAPALRGGTETILLVEDDSTVRLLTRRILEAFDYRVIEAASGREAMETWRNRASEIDLLLTDIVMPDGVTGRELAEALFLEKPALKAIFMSGYSRDVAGKGTDFIRRTKNYFLQKPFSSSLLIQTVRQCLDER